jgi:hypothetical protein
VKVADRMTYILWLIGADMSDEFAFKWALTWLAAFGAMSIAGISFRLPLPSNAGACLAVGALCGAIIFGPIVYRSLRHE